MIDYEDVIRVPREGLIPYRTENIIPQDMQNRINNILIQKQCIKKRVSSLAKQICKDYADKKEIAIVPILKGAFMFAADFIREIYNHGGPEIKLDFFQTSGYGDKIKRGRGNSKYVTIELEPKKITKKDVLLVEDLIEEGFTLSDTQKHLLKRKHVNSLKTCVLLNKILENPSQEVKELRKNLKLDYVGFEIPDVWVVGYGLDAKEEFRELPFIASANKDYYR